MVACNKVTGKKVTFSRRHGDESILLPRVKLILSNSKSDFIHAIYIKE